MGGVIRAGGGGEGVRSNKLSEIRVDLVVWSGEKWVNEVKYVCLWLANTYIDERGLYGSV